MRWTRRPFSILHSVIAVLFYAASLLLVAIAASVGLTAFDVPFDRAAGQRVIEAMGVLTAGVVALQIAQTIAEEEVVRDAHISGPTRVRRFLSRFLVVVVVALSIEAIVATFRAAHEGGDHLVDAAVMVFGIGFLLGGWGLFLGMNRSAEELEPEAMRDAKQEDEKLK